VQVLRRGCRKRSPANVHAPNGACTLWEALQTDLFPPSFREGGAGIAPAPTSSLPTVLLYRYENVMPRGELWPPLE
jgi:hypothetical protein